MNILKEDEYVDNAYSKGNEPIDNPIDDYDELDVEQEDMDDFINYLKAYSQSLDEANCCLLYTSPSPRDRQKSRMPSSA